MTTSGLSLWKRVALSLYYTALASYRRAARRRWLDDGRAPVIVLMYHRVADDRATPWTLGNRTFARQIGWLQRHFDLVGFSEAQERMLGGNRRPAVSITFDDGYADNCAAALPLLVKLRIPCTYFVTSQNILAGRPFAHDVALGATHCRPNTAEQVRALAKTGIEIAGHTRTHADLGAIDGADRLEEEIVGGAEELEAITGRPMRYFAFPFGQQKNLTALAFDVARRAGFDAVCSAYGGYNFAGDDPFHLQRFAVDDDMIRLKNTCGVDPRKLRLHPRFDFGCETAIQEPAAAAR